MIRFAIAAAIFVLLGGCDRESTPPPTELPPVQPEPTPEPEPAPEPTLDQRTTTLVDTIEALGRVHTEHADDCPALAGALQTFEREHGGTLVGAGAELHARIDADEALRERVRVAMEAVMSVSMGCREDPVFKTARDELRATRVPSPP